MKMATLLKVLCLYILIGVCKGNIEISAMNPRESVCAGDTVSFEMEITGAGNQFTVDWFDPYWRRVMYETGDDYSLNVDETLLTINDTLPRHAGTYLAAVRGHGDFVTFNLEVQDIYLHPLVKSPVQIELGGKGVLMVNRSEGGDLWWLHGGDMVVRYGYHYSLVDTQDPTTAGLEISDSSAEQAGFYEAVLEDGKCHARYVFEVHVEGTMQLWAVNSDESVCAGDTVSFSLKITGGGKQFVLEWFDPNNQLLDDNEHYSLNVNSTVLTIHDASSPHAGTYKALIRDVTDDSYVAAEYFDLTVQDIYPHSLVKSPVVIELGGKGTLTVNISEGGDVWWTHDEKVLGFFEDFHYSFVGSQDSTTAGLEISNASAEQAGFYEAILIKGSCHVRNAFEVRVEEIVTDDGVESDTEEKLWGIIDQKYLKVFSGDFTGEWYIAPAVLAIGVILFIAVIICIIRQKGRGKRSRKEKRDVEDTQVWFEEPIYATVPERVFYPPADTSYGISPVTSSHPQSSSLGMSMLSTKHGHRVISSFDPLLGPTVPPPTSGLTQTYSAMSELEDSSDD